MFKPLIIKEIKIRTNEVGSPSPVPLAKIKQLGSILCDMAMRNQVVLNMIIATPSLCGCDNNLSNCKCIPVYMCINSS